MPINTPSFDELNNIRTIVELELYAGLYDRKVDRKRIEDMIFDLLTMAYAFGIEKAGLDLGDEPTSNDDMRRDAIEAPTAGKTVFERMNAHIDAASEQIAAGGPAAVAAASRLAEQLSVLIDTEAGRVANTAIFDAAEEYQRRNPGKQVMKRWVTMADDRVRDTHQYLEGTEVPLDAYFYSYSGDKALFPHGFQTAQEVVNCRCTCELFVR